MSDFVYEAISSNCMLWSSELVDVKVCSCRHCQRLAVKPNLDCCQDDASHRAPLRGVDVPSRDLISPSRSEIFFNMPMVSSRVAVVDSYGVTRDGSSARAFFVISGPRGICGEWNHWASTCLKEAVRTDLDALSNS